MNEGMNACYRPVSSELLVVAVLSLLGLSLLGALGVTSSTRAAAAQLIYSVLRDGRLFSHRVSAMLHKSSRSKLCAKMTSRQVPRVKKAPITATQQIQAALS